MPAIKLTPQDMAAVGYTGKHTANAMNLSPEDMAAVGYIAPRQDTTMGQNIKAGLIGAGAEINDIFGGAVENLGKLTGNQSIQDWAQPNVQAGKNWMAAAKDINPTAALVGKGAVDTASIVALPGSTIPRIALSGAAVGLATSDEDNAPDILIDGIKGAAISSGVAAVINKGAQMVAAGGRAAAEMSKPVAAIAKNFDIVMKNADDFSRNALDTVLKKHGGDLLNSSPEDVVSAIAATQAKVKGQANDLYAFRDALAKSENAMVSKNNLKAIQDELVSSISGGATKETKAALAQVKSIVGSGTPIDFSKAQSLLSDIGKSTNKAVVSGDSAMAFQLGKVKDAILKDIDESATVSKDLLQANKFANEFYRDVYTPVKDLKVMDAMVGKIEDTKYIQQLLKRASSKPMVMRGIEQLDSETKMALIGAHQNALMASKIAETGEMNVSAYANALDASIKQNKGLLKGMDILEDMQSLANVIGAKAAIGKAPNVGLPGVAGVAAAVGTANPAALAIGLMRPGQYLYAAGKMLNNKAAQDLLRTMKGMKAYPDSAVSKMTSNKIIDIFGRHLSKYVSIMAQHIKF